jgi:hypothetical protein
VTADDWGNLDYTEYAPLLESQRTWLAVASDEDFRTKILQPADRLFDEIGTKGTEWSAGQANRERIAQIVKALVTTTRIVMARGIVLRLEPFVERLATGSHRANAARALVAITMDRLLIAEAVERRFVVALQQFGSTDLVRHAIGARPSDNYATMLEIAGDSIEDREAQRLAADIAKLAPDAIRDATRANQLIASLFAE